MVWLASLSPKMDTSEKIGAAKIAAEDLIKDLEKVMDRANAALIHDRPAHEIDAESPELFQLQLAVSRVSKAAWESKALLLSVAGMRPLTRLTPLPPYPFKSQQRG